MTPSTRRLLVLRTLATALTLAAAGAPGAWAQANPSRPITVVIPFPPGGATDVIGRLVGEKMAEKLKQPVVIDNRAGAGTVIGAGYVAKAAPDGYTLLVSSGTTFTVNPAIRPKLPYDPVKSFDPIGLAGRTGLVVLAKQDAPFSTLQQVTQAAKAKPGGWLYGSYGTGTTAQFAGEMLWHAAGVKVGHVPYKGSAPAMMDLIGGQIPLTIDTVAAALPQIKAGKVKALAVTTAKRSSLMPSVPTAAEAGLSGIDMDTWLAVVAPHGLPPEVKRTLERTLAEIVADPQTQASMKANGFEPAYLDAAGLAALIDRELPLMRAIAQRANIQAD
jgi:tripartite-type tricarboxylate transporter receptor subunit TctC